MPHGDEISSTQTRHGAAKLTRLVPLTGSQMAGASHRHAFSGFLLRLSKQFQTSWEGGDDLPLSSLEKRHGLLE